MLAGSVDETSLAKALGSAGVDVTPELVHSLVAEGRDHAERRRLEDSQRALVEQIGIPTYELAQLAGRGRHGRALRAGPVADASRGSPDAGQTTSRTGPMTASHAPVPELDVDALLDDPKQRIIVCCGSGGVGKTTTAASLALRAAERGRKVVVLTIDPARRLAQSMGIEALDNTPRPVPGVSEEPGAGSLDAMMLDMKRTFDEVVESQASPEKAQQILNNPFYVAVSSSFAGTQEYMAMEKLGQLDKDARASGSLGPDRRRHPAVAQRAGLPRRPRATVELPRRQVHEAAARTRPAVRHG